MQRILADIDESAPIPPRRIAKKIEGMRLEERDTVFNGENDQGRSAQRPA
jgi:hypothetical protein